MDLDLSKLEKHRTLLNEENVSHIEAVSSRVYFHKYSKLIDERFGFSSRNSIQIQKYDATDVINAIQVNSSGKKSYDLSHNLGDGMNIVKF